MSRGDVEVKVLGSKEAQAAIRMLAARSEDEARRVVNETAINVQRGARQRTPVDTGRLRASIHIKFENDALAGYVYTDLEYAAAVEHGRSAGKRMPHSSYLEDWMKRKGIPQSAGYVIARSIGQRGIPSRRFMLPAAQEEQPAFWRRTREGMMRVIREADK